MGIFFRIVNSRWFSMLNAITESKFETKQQLLKPLKTVLAFLQVARRVPILTL